MILEIFGFFIFISIALIVIGYYTDIKVMASIGFASLFLLSLSLQAGAIQNKTSTNITTSGATTTITPTYSDLNDTTSVWIGRWLAVVSVLGAILVWTSNKKREDEE